MSAVERAQNHQDARNDQDATREPYEAPSAILVREIGEGTWVEGEPPCQVYWVLDRYTEPRESLFDCAACGQEIEDWDFATCLDGGEAAHLSCLESRS